MIVKDNTVLIIIDVQGKLSEIVYRSELLFERLEKLVQGAQILEVPILLTEQLPDKLGPTKERINKLIPQVDAITKKSFSCCNNREFSLKLEGMNSKNVILAGIEAHVCIYQTAMDLLNEGYSVEVVRDAVSSRTEENYELALDKISREGGEVTSVEMLLFELQKVAEGREFSKLLKLIK